VVKMLDDEKAISPVVGMILILAILAIAISVISSHWFPILRKDAEIKHNERLKDEFLDIVTVYSMLDRNESKVISLKLGSNQPSFSHTTTSSTLSVRESGWIKINLTYDNFSYSIRYKLFMINLSIHNSFIPDETLVFSEGGIKIYQGGTNITRLNPNLQLCFDNASNTLFLGVDNFTDNFQEVSGNGVAFLSLNMNSRHLNFSNCTGNIRIQDEIFSDEWRDIMSELDSNSVFSFDPSTNTLSINSPINVSLTIRDFKVALS